MTGQGEGGAVLGEDDIIALAAVLHAHMPWPQAEMCAGLLAPAVAALVDQARADGEMAGRRATLSRLRDLANMAEPDGQDTAYQVLSINLRWAADQIEWRGTQDHD